ncbi:MAG: ribosome small subunit-dependent GTPase A [Gammaproteobacteria bacterium]|nr:ribosome small subunit-dependent GTPase A [Gammaproteobacteria bacterium]MDH3806861.1 ribosome small subunit-dependent GTPase A [Gammaproteobacteria bacterium]
MPQENAVVIATYSRRMGLRLEDGREVDARIKGKRLKPVCGDRVVAEPIEEESDWLITQILDRANSLNRPNMRGQTEVLAANVEFLIVVAAGSPDPDWFIVDRYLCAAESMKVPAAVVYNKTDLELQDKKIESALRDYERIYPTVRCSARTGSNIDAIQATIRGKTGIIVGQSGVGKSSIINHLMGGETQRTAEISGKTGEGKHTTVNSMMLTLPDGGAIIDSPGVRDYAPALQSVPEVIQGFREIEKAGHDCRFANCRHLREPGCAVKTAVENETISARRYESYRRLLALTEKLERQL